MTFLDSLLNHSLGSHSLLVLLIAFVGGIASSVLPCTIAMLPVLIGYIGGYSYDSKWDVFRQAALFIIGLAVVMSVLGVLAGILGVAFGSLIGSAWYYVIGGLSILMALNLLGILHIPMPQLISKLPESNTGKILAPFLLGAAFGLTASPCGTPFLAAILAFISREKNIFLGGAALFCYALGQGALLLIVGLCTGLLKHMAMMRHVGNIITKLSATLFIIFGGMLIAIGAGAYPQILAFLHVLPTP